MSYVNNYRPPTKGPIIPQLDDPVDLNFCFPIPDKLESERVKLVPFIPSLHATQYLSAVASAPELYDYLLYGPFTPEASDAFYQWFEESMRRDSGVLLFAIIDKTSPGPESHPDQGGALAGVLSYLLTFPENLATEIGHVLVFKPWHRTFVTTNAVGLLLIHAFEVYGMRRVQWQANERNAPSVRTAVRMDFKWEGVVRWQRILPADRIKAGASAKEKKCDPRPDEPGRHTALLAMCWDGYVRSDVEKLMARKA